MTLRHFVIAAVLALAFVPLCSRAAVPAVSQVDLYLSRLEALGFSGNILIAQNGVLFQKGYGLADRERNLPMTATTVLPIGSITKQFTAAAILKLEMQGKLRTTDTIGAFIPNVPPDKAGITIHQLLTHTAGLDPDYTLTDFEAVDRATFIARVMHRPLNATPGTHFLYSNAGYALLAAIVEIASKKPYETYLHENLFVPARMFLTGYRIPHWKEGQIAIGYRNGTRWGTIPAHGWAPDGPYWGLKGNGGIHSTPQDMYRWHLALMKNTVLSAQARKKFETGYVNEGPEGMSKYAYGWSVVQSPQGKLVTHNGGDGIYAADFLRYLDAGVVIYIASNNSTVSAAGISRRVARLAFGSAVPMPPATVALGPANLANLAGTYRLPSGQDVTVATEGNHLAIRTDDPLAFAALNPTKPPPQIAQSVLARTQEFIKNGGPADPNYPIWNNIIAKDGALSGAELIGISSVGGNPAVWIRGHFARRVEYVQLIWGPDRLEAFTLSDGAPPIAYYPASASEFFAYDIALSQVQRIHFGADHTVTLEQ
jgi:CubicO group peptidase (beta-lactamase class C family)